MMIMSEYLHFGRNDTLNMEIGELEYYLSQLEKRASKNNKSTT